MSALFRSTPKHAPLPKDPNDERRPSHWNDELSDIAVDPQLEYPSNVDHVRALGFTPPPNPTPVYLTETPPADRAIRKWDGGNVLVDTTPIQLTGADRRRKRMIVINTGDTNPVYLSPGREDQTFMCLMLEPNQAIEMLHNDFVWARCAAAQSTNVTWTVEYELEES